MATPPKKYLLGSRTVEHIIKYVSLAIMISGAVVGILRVTAAPYIKGEIDTAIQVNNRWLEQQYAGKNELLIKIYESQQKTTEQIIELKTDVATIKGRLGK